MIEGICPELDSKVGSGEESSNRIREGSVGALNRAILERSLSASGSDFIAFGCEEIPNVRVIIELAALIKMDIFSFASVAGGIL